MSEPAGMLMDIERNSDDDNKSRQIEGGLQKKNRLKSFLQDVMEDVNDGNVRAAVNALSNPDIRVIYFELYNVDITKLPKLKVSVMYSCIKTLLRKWTGYYDTAFGIDESCSLLLDYLRENLKYVNSVYHENEAKCMKAEKNINNKNIVEVLCPYRQLKSLVYYNVHPKSHSVINTTIEAKSVVNSSRSLDLFRDIFNIPHIEIKIACPSFIISRQNIHRSEYKFVRLTPEYSPKLKALDMRLKYSRGTKTSTDSFPSSFILDFFSQFKSAIRVDKSYSVSKKMDLLGFLTELSHEIKKCTHEIESNTDYYSYINKYPYVRYLGQKAVNKPEKAVDYESQTTIEEDSLNLRLQEVIYPCIKFSLSKFNVSYHIDEKGKNKFNFSPDFVSMVMNRYTIFKCTLCHFERVGQMAKYEIETHIYEEHGDEPNWYCVKCKTQFPMKVLCAQRWNHSCSYVVEKIKKKKAKLADKTTHT